MNPNEIERIGPYPVRRFIAEGGMAWVFEVTDPDLFDAPLALKMLKPGMSEEIFRRFKEEAGMLTRLDHPNLITIRKFGFDEASGCHYYTMTLVTGGHLGSRGVVSLEEAEEVFLGVLSGLAKLHENNIIHRDIKPSNILMGEDGRPKLADLGIARTANVAEGDTWYQNTRPGATSTGMAIGTPAYMSPEQARAQRGIGKPTDVFSFGLTMYSALTGHSIYDEIPGVDSTSGMDILQYLGHLRLSRGEFEFRFDSEFRVPPSVQDVIRTACAIDPAGRYPDATAMLRAFRQALADPDASTGEHELGRRDAIAAGSRTSIVPIAAGAFVVIALAVAGYVFRDRFLGAVDSRGAPKLTLESVSELERDVAGVLESAEASKPAPAPDVVKAAREKRDIATTLLQQSRRKQESGQSADAYLADSHASFLEACQLIVAGDLDARFTRGSEEAKRVAAGLGELQVKELAAADWARLEQQLAGITPPEADAPACVRALHFQAELAKVDAAMRTGEEVEQKLEKEWPRLASDARSEVLHAQSALAQTELDLPAFTAAITRGNQALAAGDAAMASQSFLNARDQFWKAKDAFAEAELVASASQVQKKMRDISARAAALAIQDSAIDAEVKRADELFAAGSFVEATAAYQRAIRFLDVSVGEATQSAGSRKARELADRAHEAATRTGADQSATEELVAADGAYAAATAAFESKSFEDAEKGYADAAKSYAVASAKAVAEMDRARKEGQTAKAGAKEFAKAESCAALPEAARAACQAAHQALADADAAVAATNASSAIALYSRATDGFQEAREILRAELENQPKPPVIATRVPVAAQVSASKGEAVRFEVQARDPNAKDTLAYVWTVDGLARPETGSKLEFAPDGASRVEVKVSDGTGLEASASWQVAVTNRKPTLTLSPAANTFKIKSGEKVSFKAVASDPDGEDVSVAFYIGKQKVAEGLAYEFEGTRDGSFVIEARATDPTGGETSARRSVEVKPDNEPPTVVLKPGKSVLPIKVGEEIGFEAIATDPEEEPVVLAYYVDGQKVSDGPAFTFTGREAGDHVVEVRAKDKEGATAKSRRTVQVARVEPPKPPEPEKPPEVVKLPEPEKPPEVATPIPTPAPSSSGEPHVKYINETMNLYEQYFQSRNLSGMNKVWNMGMMDRIAMQEIFKSCAAGKLEVSLKLGKPALVGADGRRASLTFTQVVKCNGGVVSSDTRIANLILRPPDEWQIKTMQTP